MKKGLKKALKVLGILIVLLLIAAGIGYYRLTTNILDFEDDYIENKNLDTIVVKGQTFIDRNANGELDVYEDPTKPLDKRVEDLLSQMTIDEKIHLLKGSGMASAMGKLEPGMGTPGVVGTIVPTPRLGLPSINLSDGPAGLRIEPTRENEDRTYYCTAFPIGTLLASSWNVDLVHEVGKAMGNEALEYGIDVILGPGANIHRHPLCGRNFEYFSEDPVLTGYIGAAIVNGIESNGVGSSVKHYVANNQETNRTMNDVRVSERALREIYLKGFEIIVEKSNPWTIMSSYNKVNGTYVSENKELLTDVLRNEWDFKGLVISDWFGGSDAPTMVTAGNDLLEPGTKKQWKALKTAHKDCTMTEETIDTSVKRILELILKTRKMEHYKFTNNPDLAAHAKITRQSASEGMTLLKNDKKTLPLQPKTNIALLGVTSYDFISGGSGSGDVNEAYSVSLEEGLKNAGFEINWKAKNSFETYKSENLDAFDKKEGVMAMLDPYIPPTMEYTAKQLEEIESSSDIAIITIGRNSGEGGDRIIDGDFLLNTLEKETLEKTCDIFHRAGKKVIVVLNIGGVIETNSWKTLPDAIILAWQGGQEGGNALTDILNGTVNPSGKLPMTFPIQIEDHGSHTNFPLDGEPMDVLGMIFPKKEKPEEEKVRNKDYTLYDEDIYVGYRHFDKAGKDVSFPFGYGLSYTNFEFSKMEVAKEVDNLNIGISVKNIGDFAGKEVVQVYTSKPNSTIDRSVYELKAFVKTKSLQVGESERISVKIPISELAYWDTKHSRWIIEKGTYQIHIGNSSRNIKFSENITIE